MSSAVESSFRTHEDYDEEIDSDKDSCDDFVPTLRDSQSISSGRTIKSVTHPAQTLNHKATDQRLVVRRSALGITIHSVCTYTQSIASRDRVDIPTHLTSTLMQKVQIIHHGRSHSFGCTASKSTNNVRPE
jgi:hypothetical protein